VHGVKVGLQIFKFPLVLKLKLLDKFIELTLRSADLLRKQIGTVLQVATNVTHDYPPGFSPHCVQKRPNRAGVPACSSQP